MKILALLFIASRFLQSSYAQTNSPTLDISSLDEIKESTVAQRTWNEANYHLALADPKDPLQLLARRFHQWFESTQIDSARPDILRKVSSLLENSLLQQLTLEELGAALIQRPSNCVAIGKAVSLVAHLSPDGHLIGIEKKYSPLALIHLYEAYVNDFEFHRNILPCETSISEATRNTLRNLVRRYANNQDGIIHVFGGGGNYEYRGKIYYSSNQQFMAPIWPEMASLPQNRAQLALVTVYFDTYLFEKKARSALPSYAQWDENSALAAEKNTLQIFETWTERVKKR